MTGKRVTIQRYSLLPKTNKIMVIISITANIRVYRVDISLLRMDFLVSGISYTKFNPFIMARKPLLADHKAVMAVRDISVPVFVLLYISVITRTIKELNAWGKTRVTIFKTVLSSNEKKGTMLSKNIMNGKKEMIMKKAAWAEKADTWSSLILFEIIFSILMVDLNMAYLNYYIIYMISWIKPLNRIALFV